MKPVRSSPTTRRVVVSGALAVMRRYWVAVMVLAGLWFSGQYVYEHGQGLVQHLRLSWGHLALAVLAQILFWILVCHVWSMVVTRTTIARITFSESLVHIALLNLGKYLPGKVWGMFARGVHLGERHPVSSGEIFGATIFEQYYFFLSAVALCALLLTLLHPSAFTLAGLGLCTAAVALSPHIHGYVGTWLARVMVRFPKWMPVSQTKWKLTGLRQRDNLALFLGFSAIWLLSGVIFYLVYLALFSGAASLRELAVMAIANTAGVVAGFVAIFAPGGIGVREGASAAILSLHMPIEDGLMLAVAFRIWVVFSELLAGLLVLALWRSPGKRRNGA